MGYMRGLGASVLGIPIGPLPDEPIPISWDPATVFGNFPADPLVVYMTKFHPVGLSSGNSNVFIPAVRDAMIELGYAGQSLDALKRAILNVSATIADNLANTPSGYFPDIMLATVPPVAAALLPIVAEIAAMPKPAKPPTTIKLQFGPDAAAIVACMQKNGKWDAVKKVCTPPPIKLQFGPDAAAIVACMQKNGKWDAVKKSCTMPSSRVGTPVPKPAAPAAGIPTWVLIAGGVVVIGGGAAWFFLKK